MQALKVITLCTTLLFSSFTAAHADEVNVPSGTYVVEPTHASLTWSINHMGLSHYMARFKKFDATIKLDVEHPENSSVTASIDVNSVETDYPGKTDFNDEIANDSKFLNGKVFPDITFTSTSVEMTGDTTALIHGNVTMLGVTKPMTLDAVLVGSMAQHPYAKVPVVGFHAEGKITRSAFGFTHLLPYIGDDVTFEINAEFLKSN